MFATHPHQETSSKYSFIPTTRLLDTLEQQGWLPVGARQQRVNGDGNRQGYQKHLIQMQHTDLGTVADLQKGDFIPELLITNSHDGLSSFQLTVGIYRIVCTNGLVVSESTLGSINIRHIGYTDDQVRDASEAIINKVPMVFNRIDAFRNIQLTSEERFQYALDAARAKWMVDKDSLPFPSDRLLRTFRRADDTPTLWNVYNTVQENILKGGIRYSTTSIDPETGKEVVKNITTRSVVGIKEDLRINKILWENAERIYQSRI
jgi:hypothetical protein